MLQRSPTYIISLPGEDPLADVAAPSCCPRRPPTRSCAGRTSLLTMLSSSSSAGAAPQLMKALIRKGVEKQLPRGLRRRHPLQAALQPVGPAPVPRAGRRPVRGDPQRQRVDRHRHDRDVHRDAASGSRRARSSRPTSSSPRPGSTCSRSAASTLVVDGEPVELSETVGYKGMMLSGVPNFAFASATRTRRGR